MNPSEWRSVVEEVESLWGRSQRWSKADAVYKYAQSIPAGAAFRAIEEAYLEAKSMTPAPAEILGRARRYITDVATDSEIRLYCEKTGHLFGIVDETAKIRTIVCARCFIEEKRAAHLVPTESEIEAGEATGEPDPEYIERIAP